MSNEVELTQLESNPPSFTEECPLIPILTDSTRRSFTLPPGVKTYVVSSPDAVRLTGFLRFGISLDLIALSTSPKMLKSGEADIRDVICDDFSITELLYVSGEALVTVSLSEEGSGSFAQLERCDNDYRMLDMTVPVAVTDIQVSEYAAVDSPENKMCELVIEAHVLLRGKQNRKLGRVELTASSLLVTRVRDHHGNELLPNDPLLLQVVRTLQDYQPGGYRFKGYRCVPVTSTLLSQVKK